MWTVSRELRSGPGTSTARAPTTHTETYLTSYISGIPSTLRVPVASDTPGVWSEVFTWPNDSVTMRQVNPWTQGDIPQPWHGFFPEINVQCNITRSNLFPVTSIIIPHEATYLLNKPCWKIYSNREFFKRISAKKISISSHKIIKVGRYWRNVHCIPLLPSINYNNDIRGCGTC